MFDEKELEKLQNEIGKRDTIRVTHEDGTFEEYTTDIWTLVGLDTKEKRMLDECKVCVAGGMDMVADVTVQIAMLRKNADMLLKALVDTVPDINEKILNFGIELAMEHMRVEKNA